MTRTKAIKKIPESLKDAILQTLGLDMPSNDRGNTIKQIADECRVDKLYPYRWTYEDSNSYAPLTIDHLRTLLDFTKNYSILDYLERRCGRIAIPLPKGILPKVDENDLLDGYRELQVNVLSAIKEFFKQPSKDNKNKVDLLLSETMKYTASIQKYCDKKASGQYDLEL